MSESLDIISEINEERRRRESDMNFRHPWFDLVYRYVFVFLVILLGISCLWWSGLIYRRNHEEQERITQAQAAAVAQEEADAREQKELADMFERWSDAGAKMLYGIRNFIEKYNYSESDIETYLRCAWNRYISGDRLTDLDVIIFREDQFLACYRTSPVLPEYKELAMECFTEWYAETEQPCDPSYVYAELVPDGIYLSKRFGAGAYDRRWYA